MLPAAPAAAEGWSGGEPAGDVDAYTYDAEPEPCGTFTDLDGSEWKHNDIVGLSVRHKRDSIRLRAKFGDLVWAGSHTSTFSIKTDGKDYLLMVDRYRSGGRPETFLARRPSFLDNPPDGDECGGASFDLGGIPCAGLVASVSVKKDRVQATIPRACLRDPRWVKVGLDSYGNDGEVSYSDRWAPDGTDETGFDGPHGPRVRRDPPPSRD